MKIFQSKFPVIRQYDQVDCGPAALLSVLKFWGGDSNIVHIRELANTDASGTNMLGLVQAAQTLGFEASGATGEYEDLMKEKMPCIAHVLLENGLQHFVVIYRIAAEGVLVGDPGKGLLELTKQKFLEIWKERAVVLLTPARSLFHHAQRHWLKWIFAFLKKEESWLYQTLFLGIVATGLGLCIALFVQWLLDRFIPERDFFKIVLTGAVLLCLQMLKAGASYVRQRFLIELNQRVSTKVNTEFLSHIFQLPLQFFFTRKKGDITARINDSIKIQQAFLQILGITVIDGLIILGSFVFLFVLAPPLGWIALIALPLYATLLLLVTRKIRSEQSAVMKSHAQVESFYFDSLSGIDDIQSYNASPAYTKMNRVLFENFQHCLVRLGQTQARTLLLADLTAGALMIGMLSFGAILVVQNIILLGQMMAAYSLLANMLPAINRLVEANLALQGAAIAVQRLFDLLLVEKETNAGSIPFRMNEGIHIQHAQFSWPKGRLLFKDLTLSICKGQITALWGVSGAGKSTLTKILQRKHALQHGQIFVDATPLQQFELHELRKNIAIVPQIIKVFNGTLLENILVGREGPNVQSLQECLAALGLTGFFARFEHGLLTRLGEDGRQLSSGELQILGLVRALFEKPQVLMVDEGMSAIDVEIENLMFSILRRYAQQHAVLLISHNLRRLMSANEIYLLENGVVTNRGKPESLLQSSRRFQALWQCQQQLPVIHLHEPAYVL